jgi:PTH2 family peptidyl-tRNA hydrolase
MDTFEYEYKQVIVVRNDIKMSRGKLAAQVAHASVSAFYKTLKEKPSDALGWLQNKQPKIIVKVEGLDELFKVKGAAEERGLTTTIVQDAGLTELPPNTITCIGIGPGKKELIDEVTGELKLL